MLIRKPSLTEQARSHIKQLILDDEFEDGRIPSETDLATRLGVSRTTIRDALGRLELEGVINRKQGAGTFINKASLQIHSRLEDIWGYEAVLRDHGYTPSTRILDVRTMAAGAEIAGELGIEATAELVVTQKLFLADDEPVIMAFNHIPVALIEQPYESGDFCLPVYEFLWRFSRQRLTHYLSEIVPALATAELAEALHLRPGRPLISFSEVGYNENNEPILKAYSYFRDDLLRLRLIRREAV